MNFLQLVKALKREAGVSGEITTVSNQRGEAERLVAWIALAYQELCLEEPGQWDFLRGRVVKKLTAGKGVYSAAELGLTDFAQWDIYTMRVAMSDNLADETFVHPMSWSEFYDYWMFSSRRELNSRPLNCSVGQDLSIHLGPIPAQDYWLAFEYNKNPAALEADNDVPMIPARFHMIIVWRALRHYGMFESAPEVVMRADSALNEIRLRLVLDQTPQIALGGALC